LAVEMAGQAGKAAAARKALEALKREHRRFKESLA